MMKIEFVILASFSAALSLFATPPAIPLYLGFAGYLILLAVLS